MRVFCVTSESSIAWVFILHVKRTTRIESDDRICILITQYIKNAKRTVPLVTRAMLYMSISNLQNS